MRGCCWCIGRLPDPIITESTQRLSSRGSSNLTWTFRYTALTKINGGDASDPSIWSSQRECRNLAAPKANSEWICWLVGSLESMAGGSSCAKLCGNLAPGASQKLSTTRYVRTSGGNTCDVWSKKLIFSDWKPCHTVCNHTLVLNRRKGKRVEEDQWRRSPRCAEIFCNRNKTSNITLRFIYVVTTLAVPSHCVIFASHERWWVTSLAR